MTKMLAISLDEAVIQAAQKRASAEATTLDNLIRGWLADYAQRQRQVDEAMAAIEALSGKLDLGGRKFTREEMNER